MKTLTFAEALNGKDGEDYINVFSKGKTELGKLLSNFAHTPFTYKGKHFESVEGYWYYKVSGGDKKFFFLFGLDAKERGKYISTRSPAPTKEELKEVYLAKLDRNPQVKTLLLESTLPFTHYYDYGGRRVVVDKYLWTADLWREIRDELKPKKVSKYEKIFGPGWYKKLKPFLESEDFKKIGRKLKADQEAGIKIYPLFDDVFRAFKECPYEDLAVVMLTNNAYLKGEMDGLAFSSDKVESMSDIPPVLTKIFDAVEEDVADGLYLDRDNDLTRWARQGVLLLNCDLTTEKGKPGSHIDLWKPFIEYVMKMLRDCNTGLIYCFIGKQSGHHLLAVNEECNDKYIIEHPMNAVIKKRNWKHKQLFSSINRVTNFLNNKEIKWT
jgi:uracil-DNA glycosylase